MRRAAAEIDETLAPALADEPDAVHQHRVRVRRLRSVLAGFGSELDRRAAERLRVQFAEWGRELGVVRDIEVRALVAEEALANAGVDDPHIVGRLVEAERAEYAVAHARLVELAAAPRAHERLALLRAFADPPVIADPDAPAEEPVAAVLTAQARRVLKAADRADGTDAAYHELRKAARRARYVAEAVAEAAPGLFDAEAAALAEAGDALHDALGSHRDGILFAEHVRRAGVLAARAGEPVGLYDRIAAEAEEAAEEHLSAVPKALDRLQDAASRLERG